MLDSHFEHFSNTALRGKPDPLPAVLGPFKKRGQRLAYRMEPSSRKLVRRAPRSTRTLSRGKIWPRKSLKTTGLDRAKGCAPQFKV